MALVGNVKVARFGGEFEVANAYISAQNIALVRALRRDYENDTETPVWKLQFVTMIHASKEAKLQNAEPLVMDRHEETIATENVSNPFDMAYSRIKATYPDAVDA